MRSSLEANVVFTLGSEHKKEFNKLKKQLLSPPLIQLYNLQQPIKISCDASKNALGAVLEQQHEDQLQLVAYASRVITETQNRYAPIEREALVMQFACDHIYQYIYGRPV